MRTPAVPGTKPATSGRAVGQSAGQWHAIGIDAPRRLTRAGRQDEDPFDEGPYPDRNGQDPAAQQRAQELNERLVGVAEVEVVDPEGSGEQRQHTGGDLGLALVGGRTVTGVGAVGGLLPVLGRRPVARLGAVTGLRIETGLETRIGSPEAPLRAVPRLCGVVGPRRALRLLGAEAFLRR